MVRVYLTIEHGLEVLDVAYLAWSVDALVLTRASLCSAPTDARPCARRARRARHARACAGGLVAVVAVGIRVIRVICVLERARGVKDVGAAHGKELECVLGASPVARP